LQLQADTQTTVTVLCLSCRSIFIYY